MSVKSRVILALVLPRATMSNDWISGTPAFIMVESWRVKTAMSFCLIALPPLMRRFFTLLTITPWRRRLALTMASPPARISPRTGLPFLSLPSHSKTISLIRPFAATDAVAILFEDRTPPLLSRWLLVRDRDQFFECRKAVADLDQARLAQVTHAFPLGLLGDIHRTARSEDDLLDFFGDRHDLVNPNAALVTVVAH